MVTPEAVREKYGDLFDRPILGRTFEERVRGFHELGRDVLAIDGYHNTLALLFRSGVRVGMVRLSPEDQQEKYLLMENLARSVLSSGADELVFLTEAWTAPAVPPDDPRARLRAGQRADRGEAFMTHGLTRDGRYMVLESSFSRDGRTVVFDDPDETVEATPQFLFPIMRAWSEHGP